MRFHLGGIPESKDFVPDETWRALREPNPWLAQLIALPLGGVSFFIFGVLWFYLTDLDRNLLESDVFLFWGFVSFIPLIVVHEWIHALIHPRCGKSDLSILGFWPAKLLFYAHYDGELTRNRLIAILAMPTVVITFMPLVVVIASNCSCGLIAWVSTWNILFACGDMFGIILLLFQVPSCAICHNQGWRTYWKIPNRQ